MIGGVATEPTGAVLPGPFGARRLSWMYSTASRPWFAVFFIEKVHTSYYWDSFPLNAPVNVDGRRNWLADIAEYRDLARQMTERDLWRQIVLLLVHVEAASRPRHLLPLVPLALDGSELPYPSHINAPDDVTMSRAHQPSGWIGPTPDEFHYTLEQGGSPTFPRAVYIDHGGAMSVDAIRPGWTDWIDSSPVPVDIRHPVDQRWVRWASGELRRILG